MEESRLSCEAGYMQEKHFSVRGRLCRGLNFNTDVMCEKTVEFFSMKS